MDTFDQALKTSISQEVAEMEVPAAPTEQILRKWQPASTKTQPGGRRVPWVVSATAFTVLILLSAFLLSPTIHHGQPTIQPPVAKRPISAPAKYVTAGPNGTNYPGGVTAASSQAGRNVWVVVGHFSSSAVTAYRSADGGRTWSSSTVTLPNKDACSSIALDSFSATNAWFLVGGIPGAGQQSWYLYRTVNGGTDWTQQPQTGSNFLHGQVAALNMHFTSPAQGWVTFSSPLDMSATTVGVYRTQDGGRNWISSIIRFQPHWNKVLIVGPVATAPQQWTLTITDQDPGSHQSHTYTSKDNGATWH